MRQEEIEGLLEKIRMSSEDMPTPEGLEPEHMMKKLKELDTGQLNKKRWKKPMGYGIMAAAALVTLIAAGNLQNAGLPAPAVMETQAGNPETASGEESVEAAADEPEEAGEYTAKSYKEIYNKLNPFFQSKKRFRWGINEAVSETMAAAAAGVEAGAKDAGVETSYEKTSSDMSAAESDFSETNVQVEGVDEGDVVKTDGKYLYIASGSMGEVQIVEADGGNLTKRGLISDTSTAAIGKTIQEFYIYGDRMSVIRQAYEPYRITGDERVAVCYDAYPSGGVIYLETYDISDKDKPVLLGTVTQDGSYKSSRRVDDYIYLFTQHYVSDIRRQQDTDSYIPKVNDQVMAYQDIYIPDYVNSASYLVVTAVDGKDPGKTRSQKAVLAEGDCFYVSQGNIYIGTTRYDGKANQYDYTELMKLSYRKGVVSFQAHGNVDGYLNNQFSMDEYQGKLRLVTTLSYSGGQSTNSLLVLDEQLKKIGEIEDLAPGEKVYSARFMGKIGYFVTFRNMDPLFSVDLSNPASPRILGELKITGFSEYLHSYGTDLLLGIGREMDPVTGNYKGLKLSMFDVSNPKDVEETKKLVEKSFEYSPAWDNHKSVLISPSKNLIGFPVENYDKETRSWSPQYVVYSYDERKGFTQQMSYALDQNFDYGKTRGFYIDSWFYVVEGGRITSFSLDDFTKAKQLKY